MKDFLSGGSLLSAHWEKTDLFFQAAALSLMLFPHLSLLLKALPSTHSLSFKKPSPSYIFTYELTLVDDGVRRGSGPPGPHGIDIALSLTGVEGWEGRTVVLILQRNRRLAASFSALSVKRSALFVFALEGQESRGAGTAWVSLSSSGAVSKKKMGGPAGFRLNDSRQCPKNVPYFLDYKVYLKASILSRKRECAHYIRFNSGCAFTCQSDFRGTKCSG